MDTQALIAAVRARREAKGFNVRYVSKNDGQTKTVSCANAEQVADFKRRAAAAGHQVIDA